MSGPIYQATGLFFLGLLALDPSHKKRMKLLFFRLPLNPSVYPPRLTEVDTETAFCSTKMKRDAVVRGRVRAGGAGCDSL